MRSGNCSRPGRPEADRTQRLELGPPAGRNAEADLSAIYRKLGAGSRSEFARDWAERRGLR